jgi:hypothetical protein
MPSMLSQSQAVPHAMSMAGPAESIWTAKDWSIIRLINPGKHVVLRILTNFGLKWTHV